MGDFMENIIVKLKDAPEPFCGAAIRVKLNNMHPKIADVKYDELYYNPKTEVPWAHVRSGEGLTLWILPK